MHRLPLWLFILMFFLFLSGLFFMILNKRKIADCFNISGILASSAGIIYIFIIAKRPPLFGPFEASFYIVFIIGLLSMTYHYQYYQILVKTKFSMVSLIIILLILTLQSGQSISLNDDYFMYDNFWVIVFFNFRLLSAGIFTCAMIFYWAYFFQGRTRGRIQNDLLLKPAGFLLLAGTCIYLTSEFAGSLWCLNWFGESWRWSNGFFKSSMVFLLVMLLCHLPGKLGENRFLTTILGSLPGCFILWMIFFH